jgi:DNA-directed RNA polymerase specialized sigma subunit
MFLFCVFTNRKIEKPQQTITHKLTNSRTGSVKNMVKLNKNDKLVLDALKYGELTLQEIADKTGITSKKVFKILRKLFEKELVDTKARKYKLI